ncbi:MAG: tetratricopeptide repeat protein [bacterium]
MEGSPQKFVSVTLNINTFSSMNGELKGIADEHERRHYIAQFCQQKYSGEGKLDIQLNDYQVTLKWLQPKVDSRAEFLHKEALSLARQKQFAKAINNWVKAIAVNSTDPDYYFNLGIAFFEQKNYQESIENLKKAISLCPIYHKAHLVLGTIYLKTRKYKESEQHLKESISFKPNNALTYLNLGAVYSILRRYEDGIRMFTKVIELSPREARAYFGLGKVYLLQGQTQKAQECFNSVIECDGKGNLSNLAKRTLASISTNRDNLSSEGIDPKNVEQYYQEGYKAFLFSDYDRAIEQYNNYLKVKPQDDFVWSSLGEACLRAGKVEQAVAAFKTAIKQNPGKGLYYKEIALALDFQGKSKEAVECLRKAKGLGKEDSITCTILGKNLIRLNNYADAIVNLEKALKINITNLVAKYYLAVANAQNGDANDAINYLSEIIKSPINSPLKVEAEKLLKDLQSN